MFTFFLLSRESGLRDESRRRRKGRPVAVRAEVRTEHLTELPGPGPRHRCESGVLYSADDGPTCTRIDTHFDTRRPSSNQKLTTLGGTTRTEQLGLLPRRPARAVRI